MMGTLGNVAEFFILVGAVIAVLAIVDRFWVILYFVGGLYVSAMNKWDARRTARETSVGSKYRIRRAS